jgi:5'(3')-deoxyribonucleotidase
MVLEAGFEPASPQRDNRPSTYRECQFRHSSISFLVTCFNMRPRLLLDVDGILTDFHAAVAKIATMAGFPITSDRMCEWEMGASLRNAGASELVIQTCLDAMAFIGFNASLEPDPQALEWLPSVRRAADVLFVTSPSSRCDTWVSERVAWMRRHFGVEPENILFAKDKSDIPGDVFVDDNPDNVLAWAAKHPDKIAALWDSPYNRGPDVRRVKSWTELLSLLQP